MLRLLPFVALTLLVVSPKAHAQPQTPKALVAIVTQFNGTEDTVSDMRAAAVRSVQLAGNEAVPHAYLRAAALKCREDKPCLAKEAAKANAKFVLIFSGKTDETSFSLTSELWSASGELLDQTDKECGICSVQDLQAATEDATSRLLKRARKAETAHGDTGLSIAQPQAETPAATPAFQRPGILAGGSLVILGLAAAAAALWSNSQDGELECQPQQAGCAIKRKQAGNTPLFLGVVAGAAIIGGGTVLIITWPRESNGSQALQVGVSGRF